MSFFKDQKLNVQNGFHLTLLHFGKALYMSCISDNFPVLVYRLMQINTASKS